MNDTEYRWRRGNSSFERLEKQAYRGTGLHSKATAEKLKQTKKQNMPDGKNRRSASGNMRQTQIAQRGRGRQ